MSRKPVSGNSPVDIPKNVVVDPKGYVYLNRGYSIRTSKDGSHTYVDHSRILIGKVVETSMGNWRSERKMYPNARYMKMLEDEKREKTGENLPEADKSSRPVRTGRHDNLSAGFWIALQTIAEEAGLIEILRTVFGENTAYLLLDFTQYMLLASSAVLQHFPIWAMTHATFSDCIPDDCELGAAFSNDISVSKINLFKKLWARSAVESEENLFFCYDSTNVNSQAEGVFLVEKGYAKDDPGLTQVNTEYVVRERDGLPVAFGEYPGSINDIKEASEMIAFMEDILKSPGTETPDKSFSLTMVCDRGYISRNNVILMDEVGMDFLLMLRKDLNVADSLLLSNLNSVRISQNYNKEYKKYGLTVEGHLFEKDEKIRYFHIIWDPAWESEHRETLYNNIEAKEKDLLKKIEGKVRLTEEEIYNNYGEFFDVCLKSSGFIKTDKRGYIILAAERKHDEITEADRKCGYMILVTSRKMTAFEALDACSKRDCVEKVFSTIKSRPGMKKYGYHSDNSMHALALVWFTASIIYALMKDKTQNLGEENCRDFTTPDVIRLLEEIDCDRDLETNHYERRYQLSAKQTSIIKALGISQSDIDTAISQFDRFML